MQTCIEGRRVKLLPCPFCGHDLEARWGGANPRARCETSDCMGARLPVVNLDVPGDIAAWNTRGGEVFSAQESTEGCDDQFGPGV